MVEVDEGVMFERALVEKPNDHDLKLIYADWLQDQGRYGPEAFMRAWAEEKWYPGYWGYTKSDVRIVPIMSRRYFWVNYESPIPLCTDPRAIIPGKLYKNLRGRYKDPLCNSGSPTYGSYAFYEDVQEAIDDLKNQWIICNGWDRRSQEVSELV